MKKRRLLLAEGNEEFALALESALKERYHVRICSQAWAVKRIACAFLPDVLVLDVLMPGMDGCGLLSSLADAGLNPRVLVTTRVMDENLLEPLLGYGVGYMVMKPCNIAKVAEHIEGLSLRLHTNPPVEADYRSRISDLLQQLRIPVKAQGYFYLVETIARAVEKPDQAFCKELYPDVARLRNVQWTSVERCIRSAIQSAWISRDERVWQTYFPSKAHPAQKRPTNAEFICRMAQCICETEYSGGAYSKR